ncbi:RAS, dexamethasone-induced Ras-related protein 1 [Sarotherodon galilaeus]
MVLLWMILLVVLLCAEAENVTEVRGELGTNVTLTCSSQSPDIYWYMEIYTQFKGYIGHSHQQQNSSISEYQLIIIYRSAFVLTALMLLILDKISPRAQPSACDQLEYRDSTERLDVILPSNNLQNDCRLSQLIIPLSVNAAIILVFGEFVMRKGCSNQGDNVSVQISDEAEVVQAVPPKVIYSQPE